LNYLSNISETSRKCCSRSSWRFRRRNIWKRIHIFL